MAPNYYINHGIIKICIRFLNLFKWHYKRLNKYKIAKGEKVIILANHQTEFDTPLISLSFNKPVFAVVSDTFFSGKKRHIYKDFLGYIPHRKGMSDLKFPLMMAKALQREGAVLLFPEGNRSYAEFQYHITEDFGRFIKAFKSTIILFNLKGGTGRNPRWGNGLRKGKFEGGITQVIKYDEYKDLSNEQLTKIILDGIKVFDSESNEEYICPNRAEYLEEMLFACPKCHNVNTLHSHKEFITCDKCGLNVEFTTTLKLKCDDPDFHFSTLNEWYQYQKKVIKDLKIKPGEVIFKDDNVKLVTMNPDEDTTLISKGELSIDDKCLKVDNVSFDLKDIICASPFLGKNLQLSILDKSYMILGEHRFNPLKYMFLLHKLDTAMKAKNVDKLFDIEDN